MWLRSEATDMTYQMGIELEIGAITLNDVREAIEDAGGKLHNTSRVYPYHQARRMGMTDEDMDSKLSEVPVWRVEADSSIYTPGLAGCYGDMNNENMGVGEVISPILYGKKGIFHIRKVVAALVSRGAKMTKKMGAHITYGVNNNARFARFSNDKKGHIKNRMKVVYTHFAPVFDALSPNTRQMIARDGCDRNYYCALPNDGKMSAIRINSFINYGIVEFRQPGHTLDIHNLTGWLKLTNGLVSACMNDNKMTKDGRKAMKVNLATEPKTLEALLNLTNPGSITEDWAAGRIVRLANRYRQNRINRLEVLQTQEMA